MTNTDWIDQAWASFRDHYLDLEDSTPDDIANLRIVFFSGAMALWRIHYSIDPDDRDLPRKLSRRIADVRCELDAFQREFFHTSVH